MKHCYPDHGAKQPESEESHLKNIMVIECTDMHGQHLEMLSDKFHLEYHDQEVR